jgi:hypothetical protein
MREVHWLSFELLLGSSCEVGGCIDVSVHDNVALREEKEAMCTTERLKLRIPMEVRAFHCAHALLDHCLETSSLVTALALAFCGLSTVPLSLWFRSELQL